MNIGIIVGLVIIGVSIPLIFNNPLANDIGIIDEWIFDIVYVHALQCFQGCDSELARLIGFAGGNPFAIAPECS
ncbi:MAG: hypothetical protein Q7T18_04815 [Sedimentisphaerales bacterium]|nr:hypothetical protein [Sedimentisphaerales bacterium]